MKRFMSTMKGRGSEEKTGGRIGSTAVLPQGDAPEAIVVREVTAFCESGGPDSQNAGDEYLHLPSIVDAAESSPAAAKEAAITIRGYLSKVHYARGYAQYNAIMLTRILTDNPAKAFTQNFDAKFVSTTKELLRDGKDMSVQQILRETLDYFEMEKLKENESLGPIVEMWKKEKTKKYGSTAGPRTMRAPPFDPRNQQNPNFYARPHKQRGLPAPDELAARIEESKTTARLLLQTIQSTPSAELLSNDLVKEFAERAQSAQRSIQGYMNSDDPHPDEDTMMTLIETSDQLNIAMSKHQRAVLQARKMMGLSSPNVQTPPPGTMQNSYAPPPPQQQSYQSQNPYSQPQGFSPPPGPPPAAQGAVRSSDYTYPLPLAPANAYPSFPQSAQPPPPVPARNHIRSVSNEYGVAENPFTDENSVNPPSGPPQSQQKNSYSLFPDDNREPSSTQDNMYDPPSHGESNPSLQQPLEPSRPQSGGFSSSRPATGPYDATYQPTPSYMQRQDSAANHLTMHGGASPPPANQVLSGESAEPEQAGVNETERKLGDMRL